MVRIITVLYIITFIDRDKAWKKTFSKKLFPKNIWAEVTVDMFIMFLSKKDRHTLFKSIPILDLTSNNVSLPQQRLQSLSTIHYLKDTFLSCDSTNCLINSVMLWNLTLGYFKIVNGTSQQPAAGYKLGKFNILQCHLHILNWSIISIDIKACHPHYWYYKTLLLSPRTLLLILNKQ